MIVTISLCFSFVFSTPYAGSLQGRKEAAKKIFDWGDLVAGFRWLSSYLNFEE